MIKPPNLQKRVTSDNREEALESLTARLDDLVREAVREDFSWEWGDVYARRFALEDVTEGFEVGVAPAYGRLAKLECGDVCLFIRSFRVGIISRK